MKKINTYCDAINREIFKRKEAKYTTDDVIGIEIKKARMKSNRTLSSIANKICSVSYLSKLEQNKISGNKKVVTSLCECLSISKKKVDIIYSLREKLNEMTDAFLRNDLETVEKIHDEMDGLDNFRSDIIEFIYYLFKEDTFRAGLYYSKITEVLTSLTNDDFSILVLFSAIMCYQSSNYTEALDNLKALDKLELSEEVEYGAKLYKFYSLLAMNKIDIVTAYNDLYNYLLDKANFAEASRISYLMGIYYAKNKSIDCYNVMYDRTTDKEKKQLDFYYKYYIENRIDANVDIEELDLFSKCLVAVEDTPEYVEEVLNNFKVFKPVFDYYYLEYHLKRNISERYNYIEHIIVPWLERSHDQFLKNYFLEEIVKMTIVSSRYKKFSEISTKLIKL